MKLTHQQQNDLYRLANYFDHVEELSRKMGIELESLIEEYKNNNSAIYHNLKKSILDMAEKRQSAYRKGNNSDGFESASIVNLAVFVNENNFIN